MSNIIEIQTYKTPYGSLLIGSYNNNLVLCDWQYRKMRSAIDQRICKLLAASFVEKNNRIIEETIHQLNQYFAKQRTVFDLPLQLVGTAFQQQVWNELLQVSYGTTSTYLNQSLKLNNKDAIRAVATANGANAISIIVPCHRIIGSDGSLVGYAGGLSVKQKLLALEGVVMSSQNPQQLTMSF